MCKYQTLPSYAVYNGNTRTWYETLLLPMSHYWCKDFRTKKQKENALSDSEESGDIRKKAVSGAQLPNNPILCRFDKTESKGCEAGLGVGVIISNCVLTVAPGVFLTYPLFSQTRTRSPTRSSTGWLSVCGNNAGGLKLSPSTHGESISRWLNQC